MTTAKNPYQVLGVPRTATQDEIKRAFRRLALKHHPDINPDPDSTQLFQVINAAYQTLSDTAIQRQPNRPRNPATQQDHENDLLNSTNCPACGRRKNPGFRTCYRCRPQEEICPQCQGYKKPQFHLCYSCRFN